MDAEPLSWTTCESPIGLLTLVARGTAISSVRFPGRTPPPEHARHRRMPDAAGQLESYFAGERQTFELGLDLRGDRLQLDVWERLLEIPYGKTISYGELARQVDDSLFPVGLEPYRRARLVGAAVGRTPTPILVPCHRVIGADGSLTGYGGGLQRKRWLLELEGAISPHRACDATLAERQLTLL